MSGPSLEEVAQNEDMIQELEEAAERQEEALRMREEAVKKREEREPALMMREGAVKGREGALQDEDKAVKRGEEKLSKQDQAIKEPDQGTEPIRASAAGSSSLPHQPPAPGPTTHIHQLPNDVLEQIFVLLSTYSIFNVLSVCSRWRGVIEDRDVIKKLKFEGDTFTTEDALSLIHSAPGLKSLQLIRRSDTVALLDAASSRCTNLLHLSVDFCNESGSLTEALRKVFHANPHITDLSLMHVYIIDELQFYQELGTALPHLRKLEFYISSLDELELDALLDSCSNNQMEECKVLFGPWFEEHIAKLVQVWGRSLRVLELDSIVLTDSALAHLAGCSELRRLNLVGLNTHGDGLNHLVALSHLEDLYLTLSFDITENLCSFLSQSRSSPGLRKLSLRGLGGRDDSSLASVAAFCPKLEELEVTCFMLTLSRVREVLRGCRKLRNLKVECNDVSVAYILPELPQLAPQLRRIHIGSYPEGFLHDATIRYVQMLMPHLIVE